MNNLIGLRFKRNVYGLSNWTSVVVDTFIHWDAVEFGFKPRIVVKSTNGIWYNIEEIVFLNFK